MRFLVTLAVLLCAASAAQAATYERYKAAVLRGVDKITGHVDMFEASIDDAVRFGNLYITVRSCQKTPPEEQPESAAFIEVDEMRPDMPTKRWYSGWMFASSAALSPLQHPVYDVWVIDCKYRNEPEPVEETPMDATELVPPTATPLPAGE
jgi:hypothetical protein